MTSTTISPEAREVVLRAAETGDLESLKSLLPATPPDKLLTTTLHKALLSDKPEIVQYLLNLGAPFDILTAIQAIAGGNLETMKLLLDNGLEPKYGGGLTDTPLEAAAAFDRIDFAELLIERGANINASLTANPIRAAAGRGSVDMMRFLISKGARLADSGALQEAASRGKIENIEYLLGLGLDIDNEEDDVWGTALCAAASGGKKETVTYLLNHGADPSKRADLTSRTPVEAALRLGHEDVAREIREYIAEN